MKQIALCTALLLQGTVAYSAGADAPNAFAQPSERYLLQFAKPGEKVFVYERYDAKGALFQRDAAVLSSPVKVPSATERIINGVAYRLRGLAACPNPTITYKAQQWDCTKAAQDYEEGIYNHRASVVLCKTLVLQSKKEEPDAVSCFLSWVRAIQTTRTTSPTTMTKWFSSTWPQSDATRTASRCAPIWSTPPTSVDSSRNETVALCSAGRFWFVRIGTRAGRIRICRANALRSIEIGSTADRRYLA